MFIGLQETMTERNEITHTWDVSIFNRNSIQLNYTGFDFRSTTNQGVHKDNSGKNGQHFHSDYLILGFASIDLLFSENHCFQFSMLARRKSQFLHEKPIFEFFWQKN